MNLSGNRFEYGGHPSSRYGDLIIAEMETEAIRAMAADVSYATIRDADGRRRHMGGLSVADEPLTFDLEFIREEPLSRREARDIARWLFHQSDYQKLYVARDADDSMERIDGKIKRTYLECVFSNPQRIEYADGLHGWRCTCECATPMAVQEEITKEFTDFKDDKQTNLQNEPIEPITLQIDTDAPAYVYPTITIKIKEVAAMGTSKQSAYCLGDINRDGSVDIWDALMALQASTKKIILDEEQLALATIYKKDEVTAADALLLMQYVTGKVKPTVTVNGQTVTLGQTKPFYRSYGKDVYLENTTTGEVTKISNVFSEDSLTIDCKAGTILNEHNNQIMNYYGKVADQAFPRLIPGENKFDIYIVDNNQSPLVKQRPFQSVSFSWNNERWIL